MNIKGRMISKYCREIVTNNEKTFFLVRDKDTGLIDELSTKFLKDMSLRKEAYNTIEFSAKVMTYYLEYLVVTNLTPVKVSKLDYKAQLAHFSGYLDYAKRGRTGGKEVKNNTANKYLNKVFQFYKFLSRAENYPNLKIYDDCVRNYVSSVGTLITAKESSYSGFYQSNANEYTIPTKCDIRKVLDACRSNRDKLLFTLLEETGIRISEALGIRYSEDLDLSNRRVFIRYRDNNENNAFAKYAEERFATFSSDTALLFNAYLAENAELFLKTDYLFVVLSGKTRGRALTKSAVYSLLRSIEKRTSYHLTNHQLRHYFAEERRKVGWPISDISAALGHKQIATTEQYLHISAKEVEEAQAAYLKSIEGIINVRDFI